MKVTVYISEHLPDDKNKEGNKYGERVFSELDRILGSNMCKIKHHRKNVWCRDYMPVKSSTGKYVQFTYAPSYMTDSEKWKKRLPIAKEIHKEPKIVLYSFFS